MQRITITQFSYQPAVQDFVGTVTGVIEVDEDQVVVRHGGDGWLRVRVPGPDHLPIGADDDPVRWAQLLPDFLSGGDTEVSVEEIGDRGATEPGFRDVATPALAALAAAVHSS